MDVIIGGGVSGLSYAMFKGGEDYLVLEQESELGGYCKTTRRNGYVWDYSGHFFHFQDAEIKEMIMNSLYERDAVLNINKCTRIKYKNGLVDYPFQMNIHQLAKDEFIDCLVDLFTIKADDFHTFKEMLYCKFGKSIAEKFLIPYNEKLYGCDLNKLDKDAMGRFFPYAEKEQIIRNFKSSNNGSYNNTFVYPKEGAIQYINEIVKYLNPSQVKTQQEIVSILPDEKVVITKNGNRIVYDKLISTMPFPKLLEMTGIDYNPAIYSWNKVLVFNLGFDSKGVNKTDHWIYFPENKYCFYRVGFYDNILGQDKTSLYVEIGFGKDAVVNADEWLDKVLSDLIEAKVVSPEQKLVDYESIVMNPAYVHISEKSVHDVALKKQLLEQKQIYSIGRYGSWTYCSIEDNIKEAMALAKKI